MRNNKCQKKKKERKRNRHWQKERKWPPLNSAPPPYWKPPNSIHLMMYDFEAFIVHVVQCTRPTSTVEHWRTYCYKPPLNLTIEAWAHCDLFDRYTYYTHYICYLFIVACGYGWVFIWLDGASSWERFSQFIVLPIMC